MTNMNKFTAQQLTKAQMNEVKGGYFTCFLPDRVQIVEAEKIKEFIKTAPAGTECFNQD